MINPRLFDHYQIDTTKDLAIRNRCPRPFDTVLIDKQGSCYACECTSWLPQSIGNLQTKTLAEIIGSATHQELQASITDGTYRYCNEHQCPYIRAAAVLHDDPGHIRHLRLAIDNSCNLRCPSCRNGMIFHKEGSAYNLGIRLADRINDWLHSHAHPVQVHIGSDGDPFASNIYRHFMTQTPHKENIDYSILTNGLMFEEHQHVLARVIGSLRVLGVSIDGATKDTYEKLRLGGRWDKINSNLKSMARSREQNNFLFRFHMVVQEDNWHEMKDMVKLAESYGVDEIYFSKIQDWNTDLDYSKQTFADLQEFKDLSAEVASISKRYVVAGF